MRPFEISIMLHDFSTKTHEFVIILYKSSYDHPIIFLFWTRCVFRKSPLNCMGVHLPVLVSLYRRNPWPPIAIFVGTFFWRGARSLMIV